MKVPPYLSIRNPVFTFMRKPLIEGSYIFSLYRYFSHHRKSHSIIQRTKLLDFFDSFRVPDSRKLLAGNPITTKSSFPYFSYNSSNLAYWGVKPHLDVHIDYQYFLTLECGKWQVLPVNSLDRKVIKNFFAVHQLPM